MLVFASLLLASGSLCQDYTNLTSAGGRVQFWFQCKLAQAKCAQAERVFVAAGEFLDNVIVIKKPIVVRAHYRPFCDKSKDCMPNGKVGLASMNDLEMEEGIFYPQALVKQLNLEHLAKAHFNTYDMDVYFNAAYKFHMAGDVGFEWNEISLVELVTHEMLHCLGIASFYQSLGPGLIVPNLERNERREARFIQTKFDSRLRIRETGQPLSQLMDRLNRLPKITTEGKAFADALKQPPYLQITDELTRILTTNNSVYFLTSHGSQVTVETGYNPYKPGSSVSHLDETYLYSRERAMIPYAKGGTGIDSLRRYLGWHSAPYGPLTLEVLETLGYTLKPPTWAHSQGGYIQKIREAKLSKHEARK